MQKNSVRKQSKIIISIFLFVLGMFSLLISNKVLAEGSDYSVIPQLAKNQLEDTKSFYDIKLENSKPFELSFSINNLSNKTKTFYVKSYDAATNSNGIIDYSNSSLKSNVNEKMRLTSLLELPDAFTVEPNETKHIKFKVIPKKFKFEGYILGAIQVIPKIDTTNQGITNQFTRTIAIRLWGDKENKSLKATYENVSQKFHVENSKQAQINFSFKNVAPIMEKSLTVKGILRSDKKGKKEIISQFSEVIDIAPSSAIDRVHKTSQHLPDGKYNYQVKLISKNNKEQAYSYNFVIKSGKVVKPISTKIIIFTLLIILFALLIAIYLFKNRKKRSKNEES